MNQLSKDGVQVVAEAMKKAWRDNAPPHDHEPLPETDVQEMAQAAITAILELPEMRAIKLAADSNADALGDAMDENKRLRTALGFLKHPGLILDGDCPICGFNDKRVNAFIDKALNPVVAGGERDIFQQQWDAIGKVNIPDRNKLLSAANQQVDNALGGFEATLTVPAGSASMPINPDEFVVSNASASIGTIAQSHDLSQIKREAERDCKRSEDDH